MTEEQQQRRIQPLADPPGVRALNQVVYRCFLEVPFSEKDTQDKRREKEACLQRFCAYCEEAESPAVLHPLESTDMRPVYLVVVRKTEMSRFNKFVRRQKMSMEQTSLGEIPEEWRTPSPPPSSEY